MTCTDWRRDAVCAQIDPELFYPVDETPRSPAIAAALQVCAGCPVRTLCLTDAMALEDPARRWGVIGGTTPAQRTLLFVTSRQSGTDAGAVAA